MTLYTFTPITAIKPVPMQFRDGGTCFIACFASLMGLEHDEVIDIYELERQMAPEHWYDPLVEWCREQGYDLTYLDQASLASGKWSLPSGYYMGTWAWERNGEVIDRHEIIYKGGQVAYNPLPGDTRTPDFVEGYYILEPLEGR